MSDDWFRELNRPNFSRYRCKYQYRKDGHWYVDVYEIYRHELREVWQLPRNWIVV